MSTGGEVDTIASLRKRLLVMSKRERYVQHAAFREEEKADRAKHIGAFDLYVAALLPALVPAYPNVLELTRKICEIMENVMRAREEFLRVDEMEMPENPDKDEF